MGRTPMASLLELFSGKSAAAKLDEVFDTSAEAKFAKKIGFSRKELQDLFDQYDPDGSGELDAKEFAEFALMLGVFWTPQQLKKVMNDIDKDSSGTISIVEFMAWFLEDNGDYGHCSEMMKFGLYFKVLGRKIGKENTAGYTNRTCRNKFSVKVGDSSEPRGQMKYFFRPQGSADFEAMSPPEGAKSATFIDVAIKEGATDDEIRKLCRLLQDTFNIFMKGPLTKLNTQFGKMVANAKMVPVPGFNTFREPFHSAQTLATTNKEGAKVARIVTWFRFDAEAICRDVGLDVA